MNPFLPYLICLLYNLPSHFQQQQQNHLDWPLAAFLPSKEDKAPVTQRIIPHLPPSVVMSQKTFKGFPLFSGSIQYSPSPLGFPKSRMCLQERPGRKEYHPNKSTTLYNRKKWVDILLKSREQHNGLELAMYFSLKGQRGISAFRAWSDESSSYPVRSRLTQPILFRQLRIKKMILIFVSLSQKVSLPLGLELHLRRQLVFHG